MRMRIIVAKTVASLRRFLQRDAGLLTLILLLSIGLRAAFTALPRVIRWDEAGYQLIARSLRAGLGYREVLGASDIQQPPVVAYLSALGQALGLPIPWATAGLAHVLLGGLLPLPVFGLAWRMFGSRRVAAIAALLTAVHPALAVSPLYWSTMTEPTYALFILCGLYATWRAGEGGSWRWGLALGCAFGLAYLTRPEALAYLALALLFVLVCRLWPQRRRLFASASESTSASTSASTLPSTLTLVLASLIIFLAAAFPYVNYLHRVTGYWAFSGKQGISMDIGWAYVNRSQAMHDRAVASLDSAGNEIMWLSREQFDMTLTGWIRQNPGRFMTMLRTNLSDLGHAIFREDLFGMWTAGLMVVGLFGAAWTRDRARGHLLLGLALAPLASTLPFFVLSRFLVVAVPIGLIWAAMGLDRLLSWIDGTRRTLLAEHYPGTETSPRGVLAIGVLALPVALAVAAFLWGGIGVARREIPIQPFWRVQTAAWLTQHVPAGSPLLMRDSEVALYANLPQIPLPNAEWPAALAYAQARGARYLVIEDKEIRSVRPDLTPLLAASDTHPLPGLNLVGRLTGSAHITLIFEIEPAVRS